VPKELLPAAHGPSEVVYPELVAVATPQKRHFLALLFFLVFRLGLVVVSKQVHARLGLVLVVLTELVALLLGQIQVYSLAVAE
jgi:hypothetical membrane protein